MARHPLTPAVFLTLLLVLTLPLLGAPELVLPTAGGALVGAVSWWRGFEQGRRRGRLDEQIAQAREGLELFAVAVEGLLAVAPEDLNAEGEAIRADLQRRYQETQQLLAELPRGERP